MEYQFCIQDPTSPNTIYHYEAIISALQGAVVWNGMYAFASRGGVDMLISDPSVINFLRHGSMSLLVGVDAITNRITLERLQELSLENENLVVNVFWNETSHLFHPKVSYFEYCDGSRGMIVGSGNLTPGGLRDNFEAYSLFQCSPEEELNIEIWDGFVDLHADDIRSIDPEILERAEQNVIPRRPRVARTRVIDIEPETEGGEVEDGAQETESVLEGSERILIAQVPRAGGRWGQIHYNQAIIDQYFRIQPNSTQRVYLVQRHNDGSLGYEEARPCVYSQSNKNCKIELRAAHGLDYPAGGVPILVFKELHARSFEYMLIMPNTPGYNEMLELTIELQTIGRGLRRVITDSQTLINKWPDCPLFS